jgi:DNA (cytosine-5)-methyltransferase 1
MSAASAHLPGHQIGQDLKRRSMKHYGDITKLKGAELPIVDIVTGGSPCQDLSVAGKRAGLAGERSGLFMEQIRIIKEMRKHDADTRTDDDIRHFTRPRYMVWENVPGAFSSNKGEDFRAVLEETARVADQDAVIPGPPKGGWSPAGCIMGDGWSIAWRVHDAQFWGVPQRRKRIALVADFGGLTAPEILFEREGMSGDITESGEPGKDVATDAGTGVAQVISFQERAGKPGGGKGILIQEEHTGALSTLNNQSVVYGISAYNSNCMKSVKIKGGNESVRGDSPLIVAQDAYDKYTETDTGASLKASGGNYGGGYRKSSDTVGALCARDYKGVSSQYVDEGKIIIQDNRKSSS